LLLVPVAFVFGGQWRAVAATSLTVAAVATLSLVVLGPELWRAFLGEVEPHVMLPFALPTQSDDAPETSLPSPQWANQAAHDGFPVCLEDTHRLLNRAHRRTAIGGSA
jgi:hypothetical protein